MRRMLLCLFVAVLSLAVAPGLMAAEPPKPLDCTAEDGADAKSVRSAQTAWAKYLGEDGIEKSFPLDRDGRVRVEMILIPPGRYYRGEGKNAVACLLYTSPSPRDLSTSRMPCSA